MSACLVAYWVVFSKVFNNIVLFTNPNVLCILYSLLCHDFVFLFLGSKFLKRVEVFIVLRDTNFDSDNGIVVLGAPSNSFAGIGHCGALYIKQNAGAIFNLMANNTGANANDCLGEAVDISSDGTLVVAGAPGGNYALVYELSFGVWQNSFRIESAAASDLLGSSVKVLSSEYIAVGAPAYGSGRGRITVHKHSASGGFVELPDIIGVSTSDRYGDSNSLSGSDASVILKSSST